MQLAVLSLALAPKRREHRTVSVGLSLPLLNSLAAAAFLGAPTPLPHLLAASGRTGFISLLCPLLGTPTGILFWGPIHVQPVSFPAQSLRPQFLIQRKVQSPCPDGYCYLPPHLWE